MTKRRGHKKASRKRKATASAGRKKSMAGNKASNRFRDAILAGSERDYDRLFEQKLAAQYRVFRDLREHRLQISKLIKVMVILAILGLLTLLLLSYG